MSSPIDPQVTDSAFRGNRRRTTLQLQAWHQAAPNEAALEPAMPIVDSHHHLHGKPAEMQFFRREELSRELACAGHKVMGTVYVEAFEAGWRKEGPEAFRSVGEVESIVATGTIPIETPLGPCQLAAGVVSHVELALGEALDEVLDAHMNAAKGRLRGVRQQATYDQGDLGRYVLNAPAGLFLNDAFRRGFACLQRHDLSFDALVFHTQLPELIDLVDAIPGTRVVLNHVGIPVGVLEYETRRDAVRADWEKHLRALAKRPQVSVKVGGMGMPLFGFGFESGVRPPTSGVLAGAWQPLIDVCIDAFGPDRCMLESNFPVDKQSCGYGEIWNAFKLATRSLSADERCALFYRTACRAYRLPELEAACDQAAGA